MIVILFLTFFAALFLGFTLLYSTRYKYDKCIKILLRGVCVAIIIMIIVVIILTIYTIFSLL